MNDFAPPSDAPATVPDSSPRFPASEKPLRTAARPTGTAAGGEEAATSPESAPPEALRPLDLRPASPKRRFTKRRVFGVFLAIGAAYGIAALTIPAVVPATVDGVRAILGPKAIAAVEDTVYSWKDRWETYRHGDDKPTEYWTPPPPPEGNGAGGAGTPGNTGGGAPVPTPSAAASAPAVPSYFPPPSFAAPYPKVAAAQDGTWYPVADDVALSTAIPPEKPVFAKALVHPDPKRPFSVVAVLAIDALRVRVDAVAGTSEPESETVKRAQRPGKVPPADYARMIAAFNGGWQAVHGHFGMMADGVEILPPKDASCTFVMFKDGTFAIGTWSKLAARRADMKSFRQTPRCLAEEGQASARLADAATGWGVSVDGETVIRRSAIGLDKEKKVLFYGVGDAQSAKSIAEALTAAGAVDIAMLDVNQAFPRFLFYSHDGGPTDPPHAKSSLIPAEYKPTEYVERSWYRDFFYVTRR
jgi:hypothetical protein